jgi:LytS/YehU family sensor histidine kinase
MALQKTGMNDELEISITVKGNAKGKTIAPLLLLPFLENSLSYCNQHRLEKTWVSVNIKIENDELFMKLVNGKSAEQQVAIAPFDNGLSNVNKRLQLLYPGKNELRIHAEPEVMMTYLKIKLMTRPEFESTKTELTTKE